MIIRKNWHTRDWAQLHWARGDYDAYMDPYAETDNNGNFLVWVDSADSGNYDQDWIFRSDEVEDSYWMDDVLEVVPYDGRDAQPPEPGQIYEFGPRGDFSNVVIAECEIEGHPLVVWLVMFED